jgi:phospholipid transport system substrate-binding protein
VRNFRFLLIVVGLLAVFTTQGWAGVLTDQFKESVDKVIRILDDPALHANERRAAVRKAAGEIFDFAEAAKRSLGRHWQSRTEEERGEFVRLFGELLERSYFSKIEQYGGERIIYLGESIDGDLGTIRTKITTKSGADLLVDYRLLPRNGRWLVYDVTFDGVSLIANYRSQFNKIIQSASYQELVKKLKTKHDDVSALRDAESLQDEKRASILAVVTILGVLGRPRN